MAGVQRLKVIGEGADVLIHPGSAGIGTEVNIADEDDLSASAGLYEA